MEEDEMEEVDIDESPSISISNLSETTSSELTSSLTYISSQFGSFDELRTPRASRSPSSSTGSCRPLSVDNSSPCERKASVVLLLESIYSRPFADSLTDSASLPSSGSHSWQALTVASLNRLNLEELTSTIATLKKEQILANSRLLRALRCRTGLRTKLQARCAILTAALQANSSKRSEDTTLQFTINPTDDMGRWMRAMKATIRLPADLPTPLRAKIWLTLAEEHLGQEVIKNLRRCTSDKLLPDDEEIHMQILKDLHRTGLEGFQHTKRLKQLLLAYARYNKSIGYCQGFNVIGALLLQVVDHDVFKALKVMVFLLEDRLPTGYFDQSLGALSVDFIVIRDLLYQRLPALLRHLDSLQRSSENEYEPPLANVFSVQWLLTLYATCLPRNCALRIWDAVMFYGSEVLLRTAVALWAKFSPKVLTIKTVDEFYMFMEHSAKRLFQMDPEEQDVLLSYIYDLAVFPYPGLEEIRQQHTFNIHPLKDPPPITREKRRKLCCSSFCNYLSSLQKNKEITELERRYCELLKRQNDQLSDKSDLRSISRRSTQWSHLSPFPMNPILLQAGDIIVRPVILQPRLINELRVATIDRNYDQTKKSRSIEKDIGKRPNIKNLASENTSQTSQSQLSKFLS